ncbi:hypothetical protein [Bradyrhizobium sp. SYSU BS000235]|uniref:hypothetical protein n=1 Tax=Bradyrhizobium sp. SYSU BS000235 TaxID=3411332 RepID=UPI003C786324
MNETAKVIIAHLPAVEPVTEDEGRVMGLEAAKSILEALDIAGLKIVSASDLQAAANEAAAALRMLEQRAKDRTKERANE